MSAESNDSATAQNTIVSPFLDSNSPVNAKATSSKNQSKLKHLEMETGPSGTRVVGAEAVSGGEKEKVNLNSNGMLARG